MGKRKVVILEPVVQEVARLAFFIESEGMPEAAKKFVDLAFDFFNSLRVISLFIDHVYSNLGKY